MSLRLPPLRLPWRLLLISLACGQAAAPGGEMDELASVATEGYLSNRQSFDQFICRFRIRDGKATVSDGGRSLAWRESSVAEVLWVKDVDRERVSLRPTQDAASRPAIRPPSEVMDGNGPVYVFDDGPSEATDYLTNGSDELRRVGDGANIFEDGEGGGSSISTPFSMGVMGFGEETNPHALSRRLSARGLTIESHELAGGKIEVRLPEGPQGGRYFYTFDPDRAFLLVRHEATSHGRTESLTFVAEAEEFDGRWFPTRVVKVAGSPEGDRFVTEYGVTELQMGPPAKAMLAVELPAKTSVSDPRNPGSQFVLEQAEAYTPETLPAALTRAAMRASGRETPLALVEHVEANRLPTWLWAAAAAVAAGLVAVLLLRRRGATGG